ncbi:type II secretion system F family protein [Endomicrobium proavitum]|uniref:Putative Type II secretion system F domain protein n=1 Tax=Endomicrobium proavitum TaxID=1408281 RepID=A0A0G3WIW4_9BACT|nr:type II secretion system F family protein [Endomicrobium proavitum]AKL97817.1 putative Type II secretion system F domain protein [Endomicrobium proavitum]
MIILLITLTIGAAAFFTVDYILGGIKLMQTEGKVTNAVQKKKTKSFLQPVLLRLADDLGKLLTKITLKQFKDYTSKIEVNLKTLGGDWGKLNAYQFVSVQIFAGIGGMLFCALFISMDLFLMLIVGAVAFVLPQVKVKEAVKKRRELIFKQLPDTADLLSVMLDAGSDFFSAADKVTDILKGPLSDDFKNALAKIALGYDKKTALTEMARQSNVEQLGFFVRTINMALDAGVGMADTLKRLAVQMRSERASAAEKKAQEAPIKMLIPLVLLIFPTIFIVIFGPIVINFVKTGGF